VLPLRVRRIYRVRLHADLTILAQLASVLLIARTWDFLHRNPAAGGDFAMPRPRNPGPENPEVPSGPGYGGEYDRPEGTSVIVRSLSVLARSLHRSFAARSAEPS
jgi:hypothetical protein